MIDPQLRDAEQTLREVAEIVLNRDGVYGDQILALLDLLAGEFADQPIGAELATKAWSHPDTAPFADIQREVDAGLTVRPEGWPEKCHACGAGWWYVGFDHALGFNCNNCGATDADE